MGRYRPPENRRVIVHHHRDRGTRGFLGGIVGGIIGGAIVNSIEDSEPREAPTPPKESKSSLETILKRVTTTPTGAKVYLSLEEFRVLKDNNLIVYKESIPYCMDRIVEV